MLKKITKTEEQLIIDLYDDGKSCAEIGSIVNRHKETIRKILKKNNKYINNVNYCSDDELQNIIKDYNDGMQPCLLAKKYCRSSGYIINKLKNIGVYQCKNLRLSDEETKWLINKYSIGDFDSIFEKYPNMTKQDLYSRMWKVGVKSGRKMYWNDEEVEFLKDFYFDYELSELEEIFNYRHSSSAIQSKAFKSFGYSTSIKWSDEENEILKSNYSKLPLNEVAKLLPNRTEQSIVTHAQIFNIYSYNNIETHWNKEDTEFLINNWEIMYDYELSRKLNRDQRSIKSKRLLLRLLRQNPEDASNYESLNKYLRGQIQDWKNKSMKQCNYKCIITGCKEFQIHHLYPVNRIIRDMFLNNCELEQKELHEYSAEEIDVIVDLFKKEQSKHPLGVCVREDIHTLYHSLFGKYNNTPDQWNVFIHKFRNKEYDNLITI